MPFPSSLKFFAVESCGQFFFLLGRASFWPKKVKQNAISSLNFAYKNRPLVKGKSTATNKYLCRNFLLLVLVNSIKIGKISFQVYLSGTHISYALPLQISLVKAIDALWAEHKKTKKRSFMSCEVSMNFHLKSIIFTT